MRKHIPGTYDLEPIIKWPGGKEKELQQIVENAPSKYDTLYEPFVGGGSVFMAIKANRYRINDFSSELINLYRCIKHSNKDFFMLVEGMDTTWSKVGVFFTSHANELIDTYIKYRNESIDYSKLCNNIETFVGQYEKDLLNTLVHIHILQESFLIEIKRNVKDKMRRMYRIEKENGILPIKDLYNNLETSFKGSLYMYYRRLYNSSEIKKTLELQTALFFFMRNYAYSGMFRFSKKGDFNVPYGGIAYNSKHLTTKLNYYRCDKVKEHFAITEIFNLDFEKFLLESTPTENDFIFLDPPYDSEFSTYDNNIFGKTEQKRLADYLIKQCKGKWMLIIKHTDFIYNLYAGYDNINIQAFDKEYLVSFMNRNNKNVTHLIIKNY